MRCETCSAKTFTTQSRIRDDNVRVRKRECSGCGSIASTFESHDDPAKILASVRKGAKRSRDWWARKTPEERREYYWRTQTREYARTEAKATGEPLERVYERLGVGSKSPARAFDPSGEVRRDTTATTEGGSRAGSMGQRQ